MLLSLIQNRLQPGLLVFAQCSCLTPSQQAMQFPCLRFRGGC